MKYMNMIGWPTHYKHSTCVPREKHFNNSDKMCQLRNAIKYEVLFVIAYFNISENIIQ